ncbi:TraX family protein [Fusibacter sp. 3D3]|uniref:TraX family protein n=1 Tax=Fusibacter sp. 3D3 TaxID=1048380 RepID=UPI000853885A|nr:TraX family protein [Fusibacter sp. 3D3]GAU79599.1 conserved membrane protein [Fusibacter sp. 3D3]
MEIKSIPSWDINRFQLKLIGLLFMTLDHIAKYTLMLHMENHIFNIIGRIAAPLFLYLITTGAMHTRSKLKFAFRLYLAHVAIGFLTLFLGKVGPSLGIHDQFSILSTFTYVVLYIYLIDQIITFAKEKDLFHSILYFVLGIGSAILPIMLLLFSQNEVICGIVVPNVLTIPYSPFFVLMGICWYFSKTNLKKAYILLIFSGLSFGGNFIASRASLWLFFDFFNPIQFWMVLFLPFIFLYNGQKGKPMKCFFYIYYPLHVFILMFIGRMLH